MNIIQFFVKEIVRYKNNFARSQRAGTVYIQLGALSFVILELLLLTPVLAQDSMQSIKSFSDTADVKVICQSDDQSGCENGYVRVTWPMVMASLCEEPKLSEKIAIPETLGSTLIYMNVDANGTVRNAQVGRTSGSTEIDTLVVFAALRCRFIPGSIGGVATQMPAQWVFEWPGSKRTGFNQSALQNSNALVSSGPVAKGRQLPEAQRVLPAQAFLKNCSQAAYPKSALQNGKEGLTVALLTIAKDGTVSQLKIAKSAGDIELDNAARRQIKSCEFFPPLVDGEPAEVTVRLDFSWKL